MGFAKFFCAATLAVVSGISVGDPGAWQADSPRQLIFDAMEKSRWLNFEGIIVRKSPGRDHGMMQVKICQRGGVSKSTALSPLPVQGITTVDDGKSWSTYIPDENRMIIQDSPRRDMSRRVRRAADQNYRFSNEGSAYIAGRKAFLIVAQPRATELPSRKFWLDSEYPLMLRMELVDDGKSSTVMDTRAIAFVTVAETAMKLEPAADVRKIWLASPERFRSAAEASDEVGFQPAIPDSLPFGFIIHEPQIVGPSKKRFVALRLSDGFATATVYQWNANDPNPVPCTDKSLVREANGLRMRVVGDLPKSVLSQLVEAFVKQASTGLPAPSGTQTPSKALHSLQFDGEGVEGSAQRVIFN